MGLACDVRGQDIATSGEPLPKRMAIGGEPLLNRMTRDDAASPSARFTSDRAGDTVDSMSLTGHSEYTASSDRLYKGVTIPGVVNTG